MTGQNVATVNETINEHVLGFAAIFYSRRNARGLRNLHRSATLCSPKIQPCTRAGARLRTHQLFPIIPVIFEALTTLNLEHVVVV